MAPDGAKLILPDRNLARIDDERQACDRPGFSHDFINASDVVGHLKICNPEEGIH